MDKLITNWNDLVFEYRHKDYGAYLLRFNYPFYVTISAFIVVMIFIGGTVGPQLFKEKRTEGSVTTITKINYVDLKQAPPIDKIEAPKPAVAKYTAPKVVEEEVKPDEVMPTVDQASNLIDTSILQEAPKEEEAPAVVEVVAPPPAPVVVEEVKAPEPVPDVIKDPEFPGGKAALTKWLKSHLEYPAMAVRMGIEGKVVVEFTVDETGKISDAKVVESLHKLCDQ